MPFYASFRTTNQIFAKPSRTQTVAWWEVEQRQQSGVHLCGTYIAFRSCWTIHSFTGGHDYPVNQFVRLCSKFWRHMTSEIALFIKQFTCAILLDRYYFYLCLDALEGISPIQREHETKTFFFYDTSCFFSSGGCQEFHQFSQNSKRFYWYINMLIWSNAFRFQCFKNFSQC